MPGSAATPSRYIATFARAPRAAPRHDTTAFPSSEEEDKVWQAATA